MSWITVPVDLPEEGNTSWVGIAHVEEGEEPEFVCYINRDKWWFVVDHFDEIKTLWKNSLAI